MNNICVQQVASQKNSLGYKMGFKIPQLTTSCCGCSLRIGSLIILWCYLVWSTLVFYVTKDLLFPRKHSKKYHVYDSTQDTDIDPVKQIAPLGIGSLIIGILSINFCIIALSGVYRRRPVYMLPFLNWAWVDKLSVAIFSTYWNFSVTVLVGQLFNLGIFFYFWLVLFNYYRELKESAVPTTIEEGRE